MKDKVIFIFMLAIILFSLSLSLIGWFYHWIIGFSSLIVLISSWVIVFYIDSLHKVIKRFEELKEEEQE